MKCYDALAAVEHFFSNPSNEMMWKKGESVALTKKIDTFVVFGRSFLSEDVTNTYQLTLICTRFQCNFNFALIFFFHLFFVF